MSLSPRTLTIAPACLSAFMLQLKRIDGELKGQTLFPHHRNISLLALITLCFRMNFMIINNNMQRFTCQHYN